jgi:predicted translation initiation factor SUI1
LKFNSFEDLTHLSGQTLSASHPSDQHHNGKGKVVHIALDTQGRKGKYVTIVTGLQHNPSTLEDIARILKQYCGAGGTVKEGKIEIQGDQRSRLTEKLTLLNYTVK